MDVPSPLVDNAETFVLRERWAFARIALSLVFVVLTLVVPGTSALILRPDNPGEGYVALSLAALVTVFQLRRLWTAGIRLDQTGIGRLGRRPIPWTEVSSVHWSTRRVGRRGAANVGPPPGIHWLEMTTTDGSTRLTRYPASDRQADRFTAHLRELGLSVPTPDWSATARPADA